MLAAARTSALTLLTGTLGVLVGIGGRAQGARSKLLHIAAAVGCEAGVWDLAGRGWALLASPLVLILLDLALSDE